MSAARVRLASTPPLVTVMGTLGGGDGGQGGTDAATLDGGSACADASARDSAARDSGPPASCDARFMFSPSAPETGALLWGSFTDEATGWPWIGLDVTGGRAEVGPGEVVSGSPPYRWRFPVAVTDPGRYVVTFTAEMPIITVATCELDVIDTGAPPPLPAGRCAGLVCGDSDGVGGVDAHITDYEEACRQCCRSRHHAPTGEFACWDDAYSICRYPSDCGLPYPLPPL